MTADLPLCQTLMKYPFENNVAKGENADNDYFHLSENNLKHVKGNF